MNDSEAERPILSVIIPALHIDLELDRCVASVRLACGLENSRVEIVVVTPASQLSLAQERFQSVATVVGESKRGIYGAMNDGIRGSRGRYLYFLGKDDIVLAPFRSVLEALSNTEPAAVFFDVYWGAEGVYPSKPSKWKVLTRNFCHQGIVYSRAVIDKHGPYLKRMKVQADHLLNIKLLWDAEFASAIQYVAKAPVWYAAEGFSSTVRDPVFWRLYPVILTRYVGKTAGSLLIMLRQIRGKYK